MLFRKSKTCRRTPTETCNFGLMLSTVCHLKTCTRSVGLYSYADLQNENKELDQMWNKTEVEFQLHKYSPTLIL